MCEHLQSHRDPRRLRAASVRFSQASLSVFSSVSEPVRSGSYHRRRAAALRRLEADVDADAGSVRSCADADADADAVRVCSRAHRVTFQFRFAK